MNRWDLSIVLTEKECQVQIGLWWAVIFFSAICGLVFFTILR